MVDLNAAMDSLVKFAQAANWLHNLEDALRDFHRSEYTTFLKECLDMSLALESLRQSYKDLAKRD